MGDSLKDDVDKLAELLRKSEKELYERINSTDKNVNDLNSSVKVVIEKITSFMKTFESHDANEMAKYDKIESMFKESKDETSKLEKKISKEYVTKEEFIDLKKSVEDTSKAVKQGFKFFYIGTGVFMSVGIIGGLIMWILNLINQLQTVGAIRW